MAPARISQLERDYIDARFAVLDLHDQVIETMQDALTYRACFIMALDLLAEKDRQLRAATQRLRQAMGLAAWHTEEQDGNPCE